VGQAVAVLLPLVATQLEALMLQMAAMVVTEQHLQ
jgi:hypothetical protein